MLSMHLRQLTRKPVRVIIFILILALLTAFFCVSLNLYMNSINNIKHADEAFSTIAVMELYADMDENGNVVSNIAGCENYAGYHATTVYGYDLQHIVSAPGVIDYELRARYGAFSPENIEKEIDGGYPRFKRDVIRFRINMDDNFGKKDDGSYSIAEDNNKITDDGKFVIPVKTNNESESKMSYTTLYIDILDAANDAFIYNMDDFEPVKLEIDMYGYDTLKPYIKELEKLGYDANGYVHLEPDTEYIAAVVNSYPYASYKSPTMKNGKYEIARTRMMYDFLFGELSYHYSSYNEYSEEYAVVYPSSLQPFWLQKYSDVQSNPELLAKFEQIANSCYINAHSFGVMTINDLDGIPAFHLGNMFMRGGRAITDDEYASGSRVCIISRDLAKAQRWKVGSKINFNFYIYDYFTNSTAWDNNLAPLYTYTDPDHFFDSGEYEVVGIYDVRPMTGSSTISEAAISVPWNTIYIPEKSLTNAPAEEDRPVTGALLTIWLENGKIEPFIERMNELGITGAKQGDYEARFTFYDQGYSRIQPSLEALSGTAELLLILSSSLLVIAALLLAFFYAQSQKQSIGTMRLLGCSKARAFAAVMLSALIIAVTGALIGAAIGHALTASVGESIMANANQTPEEFLAFSAYLAESTQVEVEFALGADAKVSLLTCLAALGLFIVGTLVFVLRYLGKGPRELLPRAGE